MGYNVYAITVAGIFDAPLNIGYLLCKNIKLFILYIRGSDVEYLLNKL